MGLKRHRHLKFRYESKCFETEWESDKSNNAVQCAEKKR